MCYKDEKQQRNKETLENRFAQDNTPDFIRRFFIKFSSRSQQSALTYYSAIKNFMLWCIEREYINRTTFAEISISPQRKKDDLYMIDAEHVMQYLSELDLSNATLNNRKNILSSFWKYLERNKSCAVKENIIEDVDFRREKSTANLNKKLPTAEAIEEMLNNIRTRPLKTKNDKLIQIRNICIVRLLRGSGMRMSELAGLDLSHVCLTEGNLPYVTILSKGMYNFETEARNVMLTTDAAEAIKEWLTVRGNIKNSDTTKALFINSRGKRVTETNIGDMFDLYGNGITAHQLRHYYATTMLPIYGLAFVVQQCGHISIDTTINNYANATAGLTEITMPA